ncbi:MAG TPA: hypothetical protein VEL28_16650 [Candidatus Binatia bacterium]|nr:hypothetical protein [Candidatus Binatia bacterium]
MHELPSWMRKTLYATAVMNILAGLALTTSPGRALAGLPDAPAVFVLTVCLFVMLFGAGYLATARSGRDERMFLWLSAAGKIAFFLILTTLWVAGQLPAQAPMAGSADLVFGMLFLKHLTSTR